MAQSQWRDYSNQPPPYHSYSHDGFEHDDPKNGWNMPSASGAIVGNGRSTVDRSSNGGNNHHSSHIRPSASAGLHASTHSLPRGAAGGHHYGGGYSPYGSGHGGLSHQHHPMGGYSSYDRRNGGFSSRSSDYPPPDHYFMPSQRKYSGEELRVYVDYNK